MVLVCLPSDALSQHLPSYLGFSYLGCGVSLHGCSSKVQPLLLILDEGYLLTAAPPDLERGVAPLSPPAPRSSHSLEVGLLLSAATPDLGGVRICKSQLPHNSNYNTGKKVTKVNVSEFSKLTKVLQQFKKKVLFKKNC